MTEIATPGPQPQAGNPEAKDEENVPTRQVDATLPGDRLAVVEVLTPAGIVRVNTNLVDTRTRQPVVVVEIEPNTEYHAKTAPGGDWEVEVQQGLISRVDVRLIQRSNSSAVPADNSAAAASTP